MSDSDGQTGETGRSLVEIGIPFEASTDYYDHAYLANIQGSRNILG